MLNYQSVYHLIALAAEAKWQQRKIPETFRQSHVFHVWYKTAARREVTVSFHFCRLRHWWDRDAICFLKLVWDIRNSSTSAGRLTCFDLEHLELQRIMAGQLMYFLANPIWKTNTHQQSTSLATSSDSSILGPWKGSRCQTGLARFMGI